MEWYKNNCIHPATQVEMTLTRYHPTFTNYKRLTSTKKQPTATNGTIISKKEKLSHLEEKRSWHHTTYHKNSHRYINLKSSSEFLSWHDRLNSLPQRSQQKPLKAAAESSISARRISSSALILSIVYIFEFCSRRQEKCLAAPQIFRNLSQTDELIK